MYTLQVVVRIAFGSKAHASVNLDIRPGILHRCIVCESPRHSRLEFRFDETPAFDQTSEEGLCIHDLASYRHVRTLVLNRLEGADWLTKLLSGFGVRHGPVARSLRDAAQLRADQKIGATMERRICG